MSGCCKTPVETNKQGKALLCRQCGREGKPVGRITFQALLRKDQIRVRVGLKETEDPIPVCYCFGVTEQMIRDEIQRTWRSTASTRIRAEVKAGNCRCEIENPSGRCCLGEVIRAEKRLASETKGGKPAFVREVEYASVSRGRGPHPAD